MPHLNHHLKFQGIFWSPAQGSVLLLNLLTLLHTFQMVLSGCQSAQEHKDLCRCIYEVTGC